MSTPIHEKMEHPTNKVLDQVIRDPGRKPSPQPTHLTVPGNAPRILQDQSTGYVAPKFEGKEKQMEEGKLKQLFGDSIFVTVVPV
jgi:hypothetical protein